MGVQTIPSRVAQGIVAKVALTASQTGITARVDVTGSAITTFMHKGRRYRLSTLQQLRVITADSRPLGRFADDTGGGDVEVGRWFTQQTTAGSRDFGQGVALIDGDGATHTYNLTIERVTGTGTVELEGTTFEGYFAIEDVGPVL